MKFGFDSKLSITWMKNLGIIKADKILDLKDFL